MQFMLILSEDPDLVATEAPGQQRCRAVGEGCADKHFSPFSGEILTAAASVASPVVLSHRAIRMGRPDPLSSPG